MNVYLDTSALIKLYHREIGSETLLTFLRRQAEHLMLTIADLTRTEFHSALLRRVRTHELPAEGVYRVFDAFDRDLRMFKIIPVDDTVQRLSVMLLDRIATQKGLRTLDACQFAAALLCHRFIRIDYFVSTDQKFLNVVQDYLTIFNPEIPS